MLGIRRAAVLGAAFLLVTAAWATAESPRQHVLPAGTAVVFVTDAPLETGRREGDVVGIHLRDNLVLDGTVLAPAGARAFLLVGGTGPEEHRRPLITIDRFSINAGLMPVKPVEPIVPPVPAGTQIDAVTQASVDHIGDRYSVRIPFPFQLTGDQPASAYTPTPARTAPPILPARRGGTPSPAPATATPSPAATKIPGS